jgi:5-methylcytosine-specific restriction endonuclease McrA
MPEVDCANCGTTLERPPHKIENNERHFCDQDCYHEFGRADLRGENHHFHKGGKVELTCAECGDSFKVYPHREDTARYCSRECSDASLEGETGEGTPAWEGAKVQFTCKECSETFKDLPQREREYCSEECYREAAQELFAGEDNPVWRGGWEHYYGPNWDEQRQKAIERDDHRCQDCGKHADEMNRSPDVHHKTRLGWFKEEYDRPEWWEKANELGNLVTLCQSCHKEREWKTP